MATKNTISVVAVLRFMPPMSQPDDEERGSQTQQSNEHLELSARSRPRPSKDVFVILPMWKIRLHRMRLERVVYCAHRRHIDRHQARISTDEVMLKRHIDDRSANGVFVRNLALFIRQRIDFGACPED